MRTRTRTNPGGGVHLLSAETGHLIVACRDQQEADTSDQAIQWYAHNVKDKLLRHQRESEVAGQHLVEVL